MAFFRFLESIKSVVEETLSSENTSQLPIKEELSEFKRKLER